MRSLFSRVISLVLPTCVCACGCVCGCGAPQYPATPGNMVHVYKGATSAELTIRNEADTDCSIEGLKYDKSSGTFELQRGSFKSAQSKNQEQLIGWMMQYANQQREYANIRATEWAGVNQLASTIAPIVSNWLGGRLSLQEAKLMRPTIIEQGLRAITGGQIDPAEFFRQANAVDPGVAAEIHARIDALRAPATPAAPRVPASQPSTGPAPPGGLSAYGTWPTYPTEGPGAQPPI